MNSRVAKKIRKEAQKYGWEQFDLAFKCLNSQKLLRRIVLAWKLICKKL